MGSFSPEHIHHNNQKNNPTMLSTKTCLALALCMACVFAAPQSDETSAVYTDGKAKMALAGCAYSVVANEAACQRFCANNSRCHRWSFIFTGYGKGGCYLKGETGYNGRYNARVNSGGRDNGSWFTVNKFDFW